IIINIIENCPDRHRVRNDQYTDADDNHVDAAELFISGCDPIAQRRTVADIEGSPDDSSLGCQLQLGVGYRLSAASAEGHIDPFCQKCFDNGTTDASRPAGDQCGLSANVQIHCVSPSPLIIAIRSCRQRHHALLLSELPCTLTQICVDSVESAAFRQQG